MRKFWTREDIQAALEGNPLGCEVSYLDREGKDSPDNYIVYYRLPPGKGTRADDKVHLPKALVEVAHYHKKKLDSIGSLIVTNFGAEATASHVRQLDTNYLATYYRFEIITAGDW